MGNSPSKNDASSVITSADYSSSSGTGVLATGEDDEGNGCSGNRPPDILLSKSKSLVTTGMVTEDKENFTKTSKGINITTGKDVITAKALTPTKPTSSRNRDKNVASLGRSLREMEINDETRLLISSASAMNHSGSPESLSTSFSSSVSSNGELGSSMSSVPSALSDTLRKNSSTGSSSEVDDDDDLENLQSEKMRRVLNSFIHKLIKEGYKRPSSRNFCLTNDQIKFICSESRSLFLSQPSLLELGTPVKIVGDIHGQYGDLLRLLALCGMPPKSNYLFLGDYVDRGKQSLETILLLLCLKLKYPENVFLLRGNHECANVTKVYGFYDECKRRSSVKIWKCFVDVFNTMPIAATVGGRIFCVHGGLSPYLNNLNQIRNIVRPSDIPDMGLLSDLLWSDPDPNVHIWSDNDRGVSYCFGRSVLSKFCRKFDFDLVVRGHMVVEDGYEFFGDKQLVTVFSAPNYCGEFNNWGAVMSVSKDLLCSFDLLKPLDEKGITSVLEKSSIMDLLKKH